MSGALEPMLSYDWVAKQTTTAVPAAPVRIREDSCSDSVQILRVEFDNGSAVLQRREWDSPENRAGWADLMQAGDVIASQRYIEQHSFLLDETPVESFKTGDDLELFYDQIYSEENISAEDLVKRYLMTNNLKLGIANRMVENYSAEDINVLSQELFDELGKHLTLVNTVREKFRKACDAFKAFSANRVKVKTFNYDSFALRKLGTVLNNVGYNDLVELRIPCVPGQRCTYLTIIEVLENSQANCIKSFRSTVMDFKTWLAVLVSDPQNLISAQKPPKFKVSWLDSGKADFANCFEASNRTDRRYGELIERNGDWNDIRLRLDKLVDGIYDVSPEQVQAVMEQISPILDRIAKTIDGNPDSVSKEVVAALGEACYDIAEFIEFYAVYTNTARVLLVAVNDAVAKIRKIHK